MHTSENLASHVPHAMSVTTLQRGSSAGVRKEAEKGRNADKILARLVAEEVLARLGLVHQGDDGQGKYNRNLQEVFVFLEDFFFFLSGFCVPEAPVGTTAPALDTGVFWSPLTPSLWGSKCAFVLIRT